MTFVVSALLLAGAAWAAGPDCKLVPGWQQQGPARSYTAENLFEYMDGNAEGYLIYGFTRMDGVSCTSGGDTILIDISEMADPDAAYGIFTANRHPNFPVAPIGLGGQILSDLGIHRIRLLSNTPMHIPALEGFGLEIVEQVHIPVEECTRVG